MRTRSYVSARPCAPQGARGPPRAAPRPSSASPSALRLAAGRRRAPRRARRTRPAGRPARAPRSPARRCPRTGRGRALGKVAEHREERLAHPLGCRPGVLPLGALRRRPPRRPAITRMTPVCARDSSARRSAPAPRRRTPAERLAEQRVLGHAQLGVVRERASAHATRRALEQVGVLRQARDRKLAKPRLARARQLALVAQRQVDLGERESRRSARRPRAAARARDPCRTEQEADASRARRGRPGRAAGAAARARSARRSRSASRSRLARRCRPRSRSWRQARRRLPEANAAIASCFSRAHPAVQQRDRTRSSPPRSRSSSAVAARSWPAGLSRGGSSTAGRPRMPDGPREFLAQLLIGSGARSPGKRRSRSAAGPPAARAAARVQVAVARECERARYRRRGHVEREGSPSSSAARWRTPRGRADHRHGQRPKHTSSSHQRRSL